MGLGGAPADGEAFGTETLRRAAGTAARALFGTKKAAFALPVAEAEAVSAVAEGALLGAYAFTAYQEVGKDAKRPLAESPCSAPSRATRPTRPPPSAPRPSRRRSTAPAT